MESTCTGVIVTLQNDFLNTSIVSNKKINSSTSDQIIDKYFSMTRPTFIPGVKTVTEISVTIRFRTPLHPLSSSWCDHHFHLKRLGSDFQRHRNILDCQSSFRKKAVLSGGQFEFPTLIKHYILIWDIKDGFLVPLMISNQSRVVLSGYRIQSALVLTDCFDRLSCKSLTECINRCMFGII